VKRACARFTPWGRPRWGLESGQRCSRSHARIAPTARVPMAVAAPRTNPVKAARHRWRRSAGRQRRLDGGGGLALMVVLQ
jgi:hypothetical protein